MEHSFLRTFTNGILGISALGSLIFGSAISNPPPTGEPYPESGWHLLDPVTYENISIFPVVGGDNQDTSDFLTLDEGLTSGEVTVTEQGSAGLARTRDGRPTRPVQYAGSASVNQLVLTNRSKRPLLLLAGEMVSGGKQDRIIGKDRIVPVGAPPLPLDVFCVEHGRWSSGSQFATAKVMVHPSVREQAALKQSQTDVWAAVRAGSVAAAPPPSANGASEPRLSERVIADTIASSAQTQSYAKIYQSSPVGASVDHFVDELQRRFARATSNLKGQHVVGVVVAYGGEVAWSDIFASPELFDHYWTKLLRSYAVEAMARPMLRETASSENAREFLRQLKGREVQESEPGVYRWREITEGKLAQIELDALQPKNMTLHRLFIYRTS
jgi:hypothetical protein